MPLSPPILATQLYKLNSSTSEQPWRQYLLCLPRSCHKWNKPKANTPVYCTSRSVDGWTSTCVEAFPFPCSVHPYLDQHDRGDLACGYSPGSQCVRSSARHGRTGAVSSVTYYTRAAGAGCWNLEQAGGERRPGVGGGAESPASLASAPRSPYITTVQRATTEFARPGCVAFTYSSPLCSE
jgi:hypothetical protein